jgi:hypothetical protein
VGVDAGCKCGSLLFGIDAGCEYDILLHANAMVVFFFFNAVFFLHCCRAQRFDDTM